MENPPKIYFIEYMRSRNYSPLVKFLWLRSRVGGKGVPSFPATELVFTPH
jgi:hypothetical protein